MIYVCENCCWKQCNTIMVKTIIFTVLFCTAYCLTVRLLNIISRMCSQWCFLGHCVAFNAINCTWICKWCPVACCWTLPSRETMGDINYLWHYGFKDTISLSEWCVVVTCQVPKLVSSGCNLRFHIIVLPAPLAVCVAVYNTVKMSLVSWQFFGLHCCRFSLWASYKSVTWLITES